MESVLAEPFPWTVSQGFIHGFVSFNNSVRSSVMDLIHINQPVDLLQAAIGSRIDIRIAWK
jgi:hypothetical protein